MVYDSSRVENCFIVGINSVRPAVKESLVLTNSLKQKYIAILAKEYHTYDRIKHKEICS